MCVRLISCARSALDFSSLAHRPAPHKRNVYIKWEWPRGKRWDQERPFKKTAHQHLFSCPITHFLSYHSILYSRRNDKLRSWGRGNFIFYCPPPHCTSDACSVRFQLFLFSPFPSSLWEESGAAIFYCFFFHGANDGVCWTLSDLVRFQVWLGHACLRLQQRLNRF
jgi:hypothetical protein